MRKITKNDEMVIILLGLKAHLSSFTGKEFRNAYGYTEMSNKHEIIYKTAKGVRSRYDMTEYYFLPCAK